MLITVLNPTGVVKRAALKTSPRLDDLNGKVLGIVDNGKANFDIFAARLEEMLRQRANLSGVVHVKKGLFGARSGLAVEKMEELAAKLDAVIVGMAD